VYFNPKPQPLDRNPCSLIPSPQFLNLTARCKGSALPPGGRSGVRTFLRARELCILEPPPLDLFPADFGCSTLDLEARAALSNASRPSPDPKLLHARPENL